MNDNNIIELFNIEKMFIQGEECIKLLDKANLVISPGKSVGILGSSGSGKTTLLHIIGLLDQPDKGKVFLNGNPCHLFNDKERTFYRRKHIGFVYQNHLLLPEFNSVENVLIAQLIRGIPYKLAYQKSIDILSKLGLKDRLYFKPKHLSGGEQQRVSIARALVNHPKLLLADEPTGNLDIETARFTLDLLLYFTKESNIVLVIVTHDLEIIKKMDENYMIKDKNIYPYSFYNN